MSDKMKRHDVIWVINEQDSTAVVSFFFLYREIYHFLQGF